MKQQPVSTALPVENNVVFESLRKTLKLSRHALARELLLFALDNESAFAEYILEERAEAVAKLQNDFHSR